MVPFPNKIKNEIDIPMLLEKYDFIPIYSITNNYVKFDNPKLRLEFLTPEYGKGTDKPHEIPKYKVNAQGLRFISLAIDHQTVMNYKNIPITVPEPSCFVLLKLLTIHKRTNKEKAKKDIFTVNKLGDFINSNPEQKGKLINIYSSLNDSWKKTILKTANKYTDNIKEILNNRNIDKNDDVKNKDKGRRR